MELSLSRLEWRLFLDVIIFLAVTTIGLTDLLPLILCLKTYEGMIVGEHSRDSDLDVRGIYSSTLMFLLLIFYLQ